MCLGIPARVVSVSELIAIVDFGGVRKEVNAILVPDLKEGDYVIVHAGSIISKISEVEAKAMIEIWEEMLKVVTSGEG